MARLSKTWMFAMAAATCTAGTALAHPGHATDSPLAGLVHPFLGFDHLAAMVMIGLLAVRLGGARRMLQLPACFVGAMLAGALIGQTGIAIPGVEWAVAISVVVIGLAVAATRPLSMTSSVTLALAAGFFHGHAHALDVPSSGGQYLLGMIAGSALLHAIGLLAGHCLRSRGSDLAIRGAAVMIVFAFIAFSLL
jgi:urease accessory protein